MSDPNLPEPQSDSAPVSPPSSEGAVAPPDTRRPPPNALPAPSPSPEADSAPARFLRPLPFWAPPLFYLLLAALFLWRSTFAGQVFLPAELLGHLAPWTAVLKPETLPPWNPLRFDGIAQFYPWRHFAAETVRSGILPLWNPYQFCGTPFVANSQSAVFYPGNLLFALLPTAQAFGASALLHLALCGWLAYLLLRRLRCAEFAALLGGVAFAFSAWQVAWLQLPTFLATSCWIPLLLRQVLNVAAWADGRGENRAGWRSLAGLGAVVGLILLAGHLQIAFYGLLAGTLLALALIARAARTQGLGAGARILAGSAAGLALGLMLAMPQLLPALELSRVSHRVGKPTAEGYRAYREYALPPGGLAALTLPNFFGTDYEPENPYWGFYMKASPDGSSGAIRHNAAETAVYVGIPTLFLGLFALLRGLKRGAADRRVLFFGGLALLSLLLALGTPLNMLFYFGVPGFGQSGSPARSLVLWALAWAGLSALGLDALLRAAPTQRELLLAAGAFLLLLALGLGAALLPLAPPRLPGFDVLRVPESGEVFARIGIGWAAFAFGVAGSLFLLLPGAQRIVGAAGKGMLPLLAPIALLLLVADLFWAGIRVNPTAPPQAVYPPTPGLALLRERLGHERIFPVNQRWSLYKAPPAVLPPNAATVYGLRDVQGYDSLLTGQYKAFANRFARPNRMGIVDASPPEVGNMIFFQNPNLPLVAVTGAAFALTLPPGSDALDPDAIPPGDPIYRADSEFSLYALPNAGPRAGLMLRDSAATAPPVAWKEDGPTRLTLECDAPEEGTLLLADQFFPGWRATLDGRAVAIARQERAPVFRAVSVPAGHHTLTFRYEPAGFRVGLYLACLSLALLSACVAGSRLPRSRTSRSF